MRASQHDMKNKTLMKYNLQTPLSLLLLLGRYCTRPGDRGKGAVGRPPIKPSFPIGRPVWRYIYCVFCLNLKIRTNAQSLSIHSRWASLRWLWPERLMPVYAIHRHDDKEMATTFLRILRTFAITRYPTVPQWTYSTPWYIFQGGRMLTGSVRTR